VSGLEATDFQAPADGNAVLSFTNTPTSGWYFSVLAHSYFGYINRTGVTQFRLRFARGDNNNLVADYLKFYSGNSTTPSNRPLLVIHYDLP
jgi:hypothetical protein